MCVDQPSVRRFTMQHATVKALGVFILGALLAGGVSFAIAAPSGGAGDIQSPTMQRPMLMRALFMQRFAHGWQGRMHGPVGAAIADLKGIQRLYRLEGRRQDIAGLYRYVLSKTRDPELRNYAYRHLARAELHVTNANQAIATLRQNLDENLAQLNRTAGNKQ
jgi:hypothetical protein